MAMGPNMSDAHYKSLSRGQRRLYWFLVSAVVGTTIYVWFFY